MWISSTATPAASGGGPSAGEERKTSIGRSRLPPAASASAPTAATVPGWLPTVSCSRILELVEVVLEPRHLPDGGERGSFSSTAVWRATMPPANVR